MKTARSTRSAYRHTACPYCGELVFDRLLRRCKRCGGQVFYLAEGDLSFLGRQRPHPINPPPKED